MHRLHYEYSIENKEYSDRIHFGLAEIDSKDYDATMYVKEGLANASVVRESTVNYMSDDRKFSEITLVAEIARYFPEIKCTQIAKMLRESKEGMTEILIYVNEHNAILYDKIIPKLFETLYKVEKEIVKENVDVKLLKKPREGGVYEFSGKEDLIVTCC